MIRFKSCPKCGSDVWVAQGRKAWYEVCLACTFVLRHAGAPVGTGGRAREAD